VNSQDVPLTRSFGQFPTLPKAGVSTGHGSGSHVEVVNTPPKQSEKPEIVNPASQLNMHVVALACVALHVPNAPSVGAAIVVHASASQVAVVRTPSKQLVVPESVYPVSHWKLHVEPLGRSGGQLPMPPKAGAITGHGSASQVPAVTDPATQYVGPDTV
jgi:hypothetical protein